MDHKDKRKEEKKSSATLKPMLEKRERNWPIIKGRIQVVEVQVVVGERKWPKEQQVGSQVVLLGHFLVIIELQPIFIIIQ